MDLVWINGPNFLAMKQQGLLYGPITSRLPAYARVDTTHLRSNVVDFTIPVDGMAMNITQVSNNKNIDFGITACRRSVPHVQRLIDYLEDALVELEEAAGIKGKA